MTELFGSLLMLTSTLVSIVALGIAAGFSPTLYVAQIAITSKSEKDKAYTGVLIAGVLAAIIVLVALFQTIHLDALLRFIDNTMRALTVSVVVNMIIGAALLYGGVWYVRHQKIPKTKPVLKHAGGVVGIFGLGFVRTFISVSGVTATYIAASIISNTSHTIIDGLIYTAIFLAAVSAQFITIALLMKKGPDRLTHYLERSEEFLRRFNYQLIVGVAAILLGVAIILFNTFVVLFY